MLSPHDIENKQFTVVRLREGYAQQEVDDFLDQVVVSYSQVYAELEGYKKVRFEAETEVIPVVEPEMAQASRLLRVAERAAQEEIDEAKAKAIQMTSEAHDRAQKIIDEANHEKHAVVGQMEERKRELQEQINELAAVHGDVQRKMTNALAALEG